jgi:uncharacterized membrane protein
MTKGRVEAFSDGVVAIIITIMVLELKPPHSADVSVLRQLLATFGSYVLSFIYVGIYWNNHHHLFHTVHRVDGRVLWANLHLLFWLSLIPFGAAWMGENHFTAWPVAVYGAILLFAGSAYYILVRTLIRRHGTDSKLARAVGSDFKGKISVVIYALAVPLSFVNAWVALALYALVAAIWLIPDRRMERVLANSEEPQ